MTSRRQLIAAAALLGAAGLSGCGFRLRGSFDAPFETMYLQTTKNTPFSALLERLIRANSNIQLVDNPNAAEAILVIMTPEEEKEVLSINDAGRAREDELKLTIEFRVSSPNGFDYVEPTQLVATNTMSYSEHDFLSRDLEEDFLYSDMEKDLAHQLIRYIEAIKLKDF